MIWASAGGPFGGGASKKSFAVLEREANVFGAELLMPEAAVRDARAPSSDASVVARRIDVSVLAAQWRLTASTSQRGPRDRLACSSDDGLRGRESVLDHGT